MLTNMKSFFAALAVCSLLIASASAGILENHPLAFNDGNGPGLGGAWTGSSPYSNGLPFPNNLVGTVDFAVMTAANFATAFPDAGTSASGTILDPNGYAAGDALVYLYQVNNDGNFALSAEIVGINNPANTIGQFRNDAPEVASSARTFDVAGNAVYNFTAPFVGTGQSTTILAFSSPNIPELGISISVNGGTFGTSPVPTPSAIAIPEPTAVTLLAAGSALMLLRRRK